MQNIKKNAGALYSTAIQSIVLSCLLGASLSHAQAQQRVAPDATVGGMSQEDWSRAWWQWAGSFSSQESPIADRTGELCGEKQKGPVWFLAGTYGTQRTIRNCKVPRGKYLFFPLINYVVMPRSDRSTTCASAMETAERITNDPAALVLEVNGVRIGNLASSRQATKKCFDMGALTEAQYKIFPSAANGYYVMLQPLSPGRHVLNFGGALPGMLQAVTYTLIVD
jgi:hypothetical protein